MCDVESGQGRRAGCLFLLLLRKAGILGEKGRIREQSGPSSLCTSLVTSRGLASAEMGFSLVCYQIIQRRGHLQKYTKFVTFETETF